MHARASPLTLGVVNLAYATGHEAREDRADHVVLSPYPGRICPDHGYMPPLTSDFLDDHDSDFGPEIGLLPFLRSLIKDYKRGLGILKEFIQNADDAGATQVTITADWRQHRASTLPDPRMSALMGPALLIANDRVFSPTDLQHIRTIGESSKATGAPRIGRYGLGFNTTYNVTDYPSFVTGERIYCFDPQRSAVASQDQTRAPGKSWALRDLWRSSVDWPAAFQVGGLTPHSESHPGTIFRLSLRTQASQICQEPFEPRHFKELLEQLIDTGPAILLFAKNVTALHVSEINEGDAAPRRIYSIVTENQEDVSSARAPLIEALDLDLDENLLSSWQEKSATLPRPTYRHVFTVEHEGRSRQEHWQVVTGLFADPEGELLRLAQDLHSFGQRVVPWAGAAALLAIEDGRVVGARASTGRLYCGLPLPQEAQVGVHLHGYFDLDTGRQGISVDKQTTGAPRMRVRWNDLLMKHGGARAYTELLDSLRADAGEADPMGWYGIWPKLPGPAGPLGTLTQEVYRQMAHRACIRVRSGEECRWSHPQDLRLPSPKWRQTLFEPLCADGHPLPEPPLPEFIEGGLKQVKMSPLSLSPADLRKKLQVHADVNCALTDASKPCLRRRPWVEALLKFCLDDEKADLRGLPLAILCDKKLHTFGYSVAGSMFIATPDERALFPGYDSWFISPKFCQTTGLKEDRTAKLLQITASSVVLNLKHPLQHSGPGPVQWQPDSPTSPNRTWLLRVFRYLTAVKPEDLKQVRTELLKLPLVPDQFGQLHCMGEPGAPLLVSSDHPPPLCGALTALGIPIVTPDPELHSAIAGIAAAHKELVRPFDGPNLIRVLHARLAQWAQADLATRRAAAVQVLDFLSLPAWTDAYTKELREVLRQLPLFLTQEQVLVSARERNLFLPGEYVPPSIGGKLHLLQVGKDGRWRALCESLGMGSLNAIQYAEQVLLPEYPSLSEELQRDALRWLRDQQDHMISAPSAEAWQGVRTKMKQMALLRNREGQLYRASDLYDPHREGTLKLLAERARTPDMEFYADAPERWLSFFVHLGLQREPRADHLLQRIRDLMLLASKSGTAVVREPLRKTLEHLESRWKELHETLVPVQEGGRQVNRKLEQILRSLAWLPAMRDANQEQDLLGFAVPEDRLYQPGEVYEWRHRHLVASQAPLLAYTRDLSRDIREGLGIESPSLKIALEHLEQLMALWEEPEHSGFIGFQMDRPTQAIYQLLGERARQKALTADEKKQITRLAERPCIWDKASNRFWLPRYVFSVRVPELAPLRTYVVFSATHDAANQGLAELGRRQEPTIDDYMLFLQELRVVHPDAPLGAEGRERALRVLKRISMLEGSIDDQLPVLTLAGTLEPLGDVYDAPDLSGDAPLGGVHVLDPAVHLHWPELSTKISIRQLAEHLEERLAEGMSLMDQPEVCEQARRLEETLRSPEFAEGLLRLIFKEHRRDGSAYLEGLALLRVRAATPLLVECQLKGSAATWPARPRSAFFDSEAGIIYVDGRFPRRMPHAVATAFNQSLDALRLKDLSPLSEILRYEPSMIAEELDNCGVAPLPRDSALVPLEVDAPAVQEAGDDEPAHPEQPQANGVSTAEEGSEEPTPTAADSGPQWPATTPQQGSGAWAGGGTFSGGTGGSGLYGSASNGFRRASADGVDVERREATADTDTAAALPPPTRPGSGQPMAKRSQGRNRVVTYIAGSSSPSEHEAGEPSDWEAPTQDAVERVLAFEVQQGREPAPAEPGTPFDLTSTEGGEVRHILIKGMYGVWDRGGIALTPAEYDAAARHGQSAWLYVVENVKGDAEVHPIRNPIEQITEFRLDHGWKTLATHTTSTPQKGMHVVLSEDEQGLIVDVKSFGQLSMITVKLRQGEERIVPFVPNQHQLSWRMEA